MFWWLVNVHVQTSCRPYIMKWQQIFQCQHADYPSPSFQLVWCPTWESSCNFMSILSIELGHSFYWWTPGYLLSHVLTVTLVWSSILSLFRRSLNTGKDSAQWCAQIFGWNNQAINFRQACFMLFFTLKLIFCFCYSSNLVDSESLFTLIPRVSIPLDECELCTHWSCILGSQFYFYL